MAMGDFRVPAFSLSLSLSRYGRLLSVTGYTISPLRRRSDVLLLAAAASVSARGTQPVRAPIATERGRTCPRLGTPRYCITRSVGLEVRHQHNVFFHQCIVFPSFLLRALLACAVCCRLLCWCAAPTVVSHPRTTTTS